ncbi:hypothetical protein [Litchfieldia alkalitelluris]|uniref:hypothetical protein n=1 Tax=Litchfieldia alkalitelluris TaxID=304268 RepID=UPI000998122C|nr:hypothetical protein [Litchfieldia alkalitelluris]
MDQLNFILTILSVLIIGTGLLYTYKLGKRQHTMRQQFDTEINEKVKDHPYIRNPVFLTYVIASILTIGYIIYLSIISYS